MIYKKIRRSMLLEVLLVIHNRSMLFSVGAAHFPYYLFIVYIYKSLWFNFHMEISWGRLESQIHARWPALLL